MFIIRFSKKYIGKAFYSGNDVPRLPDFSLSPLYCSNASITEWNNILFDILRLILAASWLRLDSGVYSADRAIFTFFFAKHSSFKKIIL